MNQRISALLLSVFMLFSMAMASSGFDAAASSEIRVLLDGRALSFDVPPQIINGRTLVPMRVIFDELGARVDWDEATQTVTAQKGDTVIRLPIGSNSPTVNDQAVAIDQPAVIVGGRALVPLRFVSESLDVDVEWDGGTRTVYIGEAPQAGAEPFSGKIAIITDHVDWNEETYRTAEALQAKYGADKVIHRTWPYNFVVEGGQMIGILQDIAADREVKALVISQAVVNTNAAVDRFLELRDDVFIVYISPAELLDDLEARADLIIDTNFMRIGERAVMQAKAMGADVFVHYSFPRHMAVPALSQRRDLMKATCEREGIRFVELDAPDPLSDAGIPGAQQFIFDDVPRQMAAYGKNTAFFATNCAMQVPLITQVVFRGAIYPQPCCPSPYHGFPAALAIMDRTPTGETGIDGQPVTRLRDVRRVIDDSRTAIASRGTAGRVSTWPVSADMMWTTAGVEYAIKWINGDVSREAIDLDALASVSSAYARAAARVDIGVQYEHYSLDGIIYGNFALGLMDYLVY